MMLCVPNSAIIISHTRRDMQPLFNCEDFFSVTWQQLVCVLQQIGLSVIITMWVILESALWAALSLFTYVASSPKKKN